MIATGCFCVQAQRMFSSSGRIINNKRNVILHNMAKIFFSKNISISQIKIMLHSAYLPSLMKRSKS